MVVTGSGDDAAAGSKALSSMRWRGAGILWRGAGWAFGLVLTHSQVLLNLFLRRSLAKSQKSSPPRQCIIDVKAVSK
jgi:hypothetical protein